MSGRTAVRRSGLRLWLMLYNECSESLATAWPVILFVCLLRFVQTQFLAETLGNDLDSTAWEGYQRYYGRSCNLFRPFL